MCPCMCVSIYARVYLCIACKAPANKQPRLVETFVARPRQAAWKLESRRCFQWGRKSEHSALSLFVFSDHGSLC